MSLKKKERVRQYMMMEGHWSECNSDGLDGMVAVSPWSREMYN